MQNFIRKHFPKFLSSKIGIKISNYKIQQGSFAYHLERLVRLTIYACVRAPDLRKLAIVLASLFAPAKRGNRILLADHDQQK
jgi:hypothetical protein